MNLIRDFRFSLRTLTKAPAFSLIVILTMALGIGANTAVFSIVNGVLLTPLPFSEPDRLYVIYEKTANSRQASVSYPNFLDWQRSNKSFSGLAAFRKDNFILTGEGQPERVRAAMISAGLLSTLGINPILGREFSVDEDQVGAGGAVLLSESFWRQRYGSSPQVLGRVLQLNGASYTVVGVVPQSLQTLKITFFTPGDVYVPVGQWRDPSFRDRKVTTGLYVVGRVRPGLPGEAAAAEMTQIASNLAATYPDANRGISVNMVSLKQLVVSSVQSMLLVLLFAVSFVLLVACTNVASLLLARSTGRMREFATKTALGASPKRLMSQLLMESIVISLLGSAVGLVLAGFATRAALVLVPLEIPRADAIGIDGRVLLFTLGISVLAGVLFGLAPVFKIWRINLSATLKEGSISSTGRQHHIQRTFVVAEVALALILLVGAGLMIRSLVKLWQVKPGFDANNVLVFEITPSSEIAADAQKIRVVFRQLTERIETVSGVESASMILDPLPLSGVADSVPFDVEGRQAMTKDKDKTFAIWYFVSPDYFRTMGITLKQGRIFTIKDDEKAPQVAIIDESFAASMFPNENPIGKRITIGYTGTSEIIGVVGHVNHWNLGGDPAASVNRQMYFPYPQLADKYLPLGVSGGATVVVRTRSAPLSMLRSIQEQTFQVDGGEALFDVRTMDQIVQSWLGTRRFAMVLLLVFAGLALALSAIGIYGVISYIIEQRTHEIGIRMALGAKQKDIYQLILGYGGRLTLIGILLGSVGAVLLARLMASLLYGVSTADPFTFATVVVVVALVAFIACFIPARRATGTDPLVVLRYE